MDWSKMSYFGYPNDSDYNGPVREHRPMYRRNASSCRGQSCAFEIA
jgi:hypothetical protein